MKIPLAEPPLTLLLFFSSFHLPTHHKQEESQRMVIHSPQQGGPLFSMPIILINFGGEMVYILEQRLHAQNVAQDKAQKVLEDVLTTMYNPKVGWRKSIGIKPCRHYVHPVLLCLYPHHFFPKKFIQELFKPQEMYTSSSTREIFNKLAHSSIMRLNESSMDKVKKGKKRGSRHSMIQSAAADICTHIFFIFCLMILFFSCTI